MSLCDKLLINNLQLRVLKRDAGRMFEAPALNENVNHKIIKCGFTFHDFRVWNTSSSPSSVSWSCRIPNLLSTRRLESFCWSDMTTTARAPRFTPRFTPNQKTAIRPVLPQRLMKVQVRQRHRRRWPKRPATGLSLPPRLTKRPWPRKKKIWKTRKRLWNDCEPTLTLLRKLSHKTFLCFHLFFSVLKLFLCVRTYFILACNFLCRFIKRLYFQMSP